MPCRGMSSLCHGMHALSNPCRAHVMACMPCQTHVVTCLVPMSWLVKPCRCMSCEAHVEACRAHVMACMPCQAVLLCHGMASPASSIFFYESFKKPFSWPSCYFSRDCFVPLSLHALSSQSRGMPCRAHVMACMPIQTHVVACLVLVACLVKPMSWHALLTRVVVPWHGLSSLVHFLL